MEIKDYLGLNEEQELLLDLKKDYVVEAGAGSGKTRVLVSRYLEILKSGLAEVDEIVAITFTVNAANEMKDRIRSYITDYVDKCGKQNYLSIDSSRMLNDAPISTIHGFAAKIIRENSYECNLSSNFKILEGIDQQRYLEQCLNEFLGTAIGDLNEDNNSVLKELFEIEDNNYNAVFDKLGQILNLSNRFHILKVHEAVTTSDKNIEILLAKLQKLIFSGPQHSDNRHVNERLHKLRESAYSIDSSLSIRKLSDCINNIKMILSNNTGSPKGILSLAKATAMERDFAVKCNVITDSLLNIFDSYFTNLYLNLFRKFYAFYIDRKKSAGFMEYEDLLTTLYNLFGSNKLVLQFYRNKFKFILIDEFQDTDELQYEIIKMLSEGTGPNTFIVGDFKQSIFGFRGANPQLLSNLNSDDKMHILSYNYRSEKRLVSFYNQFFGGLISDSYIEMQSNKGIIRDTPVMEIIYSPSSGKDRLEAEAESVVSRIRELNDEGYNFGDIAIILKSNNTMHYFESALAENGIEYQTSDSSGLFGKQEIRDIVSFLKYILNPNDRISEACVLRSVFFGASDTELYNYFAGNKSEESLEYTNFIDDIRSEIIHKKPYESLKLVLDKTGYRSCLLALKSGVEKYNNIISLLEIFSAMQSEGNNLKEIIEYLDLSNEYGNEYVSNQDLEKSNSVKILSVHKAKGLEFPVVILADLNHGTGGDNNDVRYSREKGFILRLPGSNSQVWADAQSEENKRKDEEEKRLLYVAMTRAEQKLILSVSHSSRRNKGSFYDLIDKVLPVSVIDEECKYVSFMDKNIQVTVYDDEYRSKPFEYPESDEIIKNIDNLKDELSSANILRAAVPIIKEQIPEFNSGRYNIEAGSLMHRFLQIWNFEETSIDTYAGYVLNENNSLSKNLHELINKLARNFLDSDLMKLINTADGIKRELPFYIEIDGQKERRIIDLLIFKDKNISICDYKYSKDIKDDYIEQMQLYEKAVLKNYNTVNTWKYIVHIPEVFISSII